MEKESILIIDELREISTEQLAELRRRVQAEGMLREVERIKQRQVSRPLRCACGVTGCNPASIRECEKGIRERREQP